MTIRTKIDAENIWAALDTMVMSSIAGGRAYDSYIFEILRSIGVDAIATFNPNHFKDLGGDMRILDPSKPKTSI